MKLKDKVSISPKIYGQLTTISPGIGIVWTRDILPQLKERGMIGEIIRLWRNIHNIGIRDLAKEIGISAATLSRLERHYEVDQKTMLKLINWLFKKYDCKT